MKSIVMVAFSFAFATLFVYFTFAFIQADFNWLASFDVKDRTGVYLLWITLLPLGFLISLIITDN